MTDWKAMARALGLELTVDRLSSTVAPLAQLETSFQKAAATLTPATELAVVFDPAPEDAGQ